MRLAAPDLTHQIGVCFERSALNTWKHDTLPAFLSGNEGVAESLESSLHVTKDWTLRGLRKWTRIPV